MTGSPRHWDPAQSLPPGRLEETFADKAPPLSVADALAEAHRCLYCYDAPCTQACPTEIDVPKFIKRIASGDVTGSARVILESNLLGYSCGRVCPVEVLCAGACVFNHLEQPPIQIGRLQRYAVEAAFASQRPLLRAKPRRAGRVALVGAGPASLSCAGVLAREGIEAVIVEGKRWPGGLNTTGVAPYKMPASDSLGEVAFILSLGVQIQTGVLLGRDVAADDLLRDYDAVFLGLGLGGDRKLGIPGEDGGQVVGAVQLIERLKNEPQTGLDGLGEVLVVGGGNTAIDAARELTHLGASSVSLVYRRGASDMSGYEHEMEAARREGVRLVEHAIPREVIRDGGRVCALRIDQRRVVPPNTVSESRDLPCDWIVVAIGQNRLAATAALFAGVEVDAKDRLVVDAGGRTGHPKVFAGGDCTNGGKEVVNAVAEGKVAARSILELLTKP
ncbi:MAG: FAD-dependent oxidoreductase [Candidatus Eisenbacteria bacterium]